MSISSENGFRRDSKGVSSSELERLHHSYACKALNCHSTRGLGSPVCLRKGCYFCTDLATIDDELSTAYEHILDLLQRREEIIMKPNHDSLTDRVPLEILSLIFICVQEACNDGYYDMPIFSQPRPSPALLIGAVCKKWRDITLRTPQLWTDIRVNLAKPLDAQLDMVNEWASRSGALPVDPEVFLLEELAEKDIIEGCEGIMQALRLLAIRWNDVAIDAPWSVCHKLFNELEEYPSIASFSFFVPYRSYAASVPNLNLIKLRRPFRPRCFHTIKITQQEIPLEWDNLVILEICDINDQQLLHIIRHAPNLRDCITDLEYSDTVFPATTTHVIHRSLIRVQTSLDILRHLTLPFLQHLGYLINDRNFGSVEQFNSLSDFIIRSRPPLEAFWLRYDIWSGDSDPCFEILPGITSLTVITKAPASIDRFFHALTKPSTELILPRLNALKFSLDFMPDSFWPLFRGLFNKNIQEDTPDLKDTKASLTLGRPLSTVSVRISDSEDIGMDEETFLHLPAVRKSGVELSLLNDEGVDLMGEMAKLYDTEL